MEHDLRQKLIADALNVWAPTYPRRVNKTQSWAQSVDDAATLLLDAEDEDHNAPFVSTYSFPRGHTKHGNVPRIDTLFIDFDVEHGDYEPGSGNVAAWRRDMSHLLVRARRVAQLLVDEDAVGWRASLSGHKGIHLFLDFPAIDPDLATFPKFINGLSEYADALIEQLVEETGLSSLPSYVDVTSSDLGRLCRVPNTIHGGATASFGETRFCVPVTMSELANMDVDEYISLTQAPRPVTMSRRDNEQAGQIIAAHIESASETSGGRSGNSTSTKDVDFSRIDEYKQHQNDNIELSDLEFITSDRPCVWSFYQRDDKYQYGHQSHHMELFCIRELIEHRVPIDVILEFLDSAPEYNEEYSRNAINKVLAHNYDRFTVQSILDNAPEFSGHEDCNICQAVLNNTL